MRSSSHFLWAAASAMLLNAFAVSSVYAEASPFRGLWVGSASLIAVNEVSIPLDDNNVPIAPNPNVPTATSDRADLRLIIHVNGAGQAFLLRDVAILNRYEGATETAALGLAQETDLALITDPRLYVEFPPQPALRIGSSAFDFGDAKATDVVDALVDESVALATDFAMTTGASLSTQAQRAAARDGFVPGATATVSDQVVAADVSEAFSDFLGVFTLVKVDEIAVDPDDPDVDFDVIQPLLAAAEALRDDSVYGDTRGLDMVNDVVAAALASPASERIAVARNMASSYADVANLYQRFISGKIFGDMILAAAEAAPAHAKAPGATAGTVEVALRLIPESNAAMTESLETKVLFYNDTRAESAVDAVLQAMAETAFLNAALSDPEIAQLSDAAGRSALATMVARYPLPPMTPTVDYIAFVRSGSFAGIPAKAVFAAADAALRERGTNPLYTEFSVSSAALIAALNALQPELNQAARVLRTELPLVGTFAPGAGDARMILELLEAGQQPASLGAAALTGRIYLPANHPTNPFRHRRHPDHVRGFNIERIIRFDFDELEDAVPSPVGYGVDQVSGLYREEIFGLHKPLGPDPDTAPIGLRTEGTFILNRISTIDTLNTR